MRKLLLTLFLCLFPAFAGATVNNSNFYNLYTGNASTTVFPYTFKINSNAEIRIIVDNVVKTLTTDYTVSGAGVDAGGNVTFLVAPATAAVIVFNRNIPFTQTTDYVPNAPVPSETLERNLDKITMLLQMLQFDVLHSFHTPQGSTVSTSFPLPGAGMCIKWNSAGTALEADDCANVTLPGSGVAGRVTFWTTGNQATGDADLTWDDSKKELHIGVPAGGSLVGASQRRGIAVYNSALSTTSGYTGVAAQVQGTGGGDVEYDVVGSGSDRIAISGYTVALASDATPNAHIGGDFGLILLSPDLCGDSCVKNYAVGVNVYTDAVNPHNLGHQVLGIAIRLGSQTSGAHGSQAIFIEDNLTVPQVKWYSGLQFGSNSIHGAAAGGTGGIFFNSSQPDTFISIRPSDDVDAIAIQITDQAFALNTFQIMKKGRVMSRQSLNNCTAPQFSFVDDTDTGVCTTAANTLELATGGTARVKVTNADVTIPILGGGGNQGVCVDNAGKLYAHAAGSC